MAVSGRREDGLNRILPVRAPTGMAEIERSLGGLGGSGAGLSREAWS